MNKYFFLLLLSFGLYADEGCQAIINNNVQECKSDNPLLLPKKSPLTLVPLSNNEETSIKITETLSSVDVIHLGKEMTIDRVASQNVPSCPPYCIQAMSIDGVKTVGELETLDFLDKLKEKKSRLVIDVRTSKEYKKETIPGAINLPFTMLIDGSPYQKEVLKLLGSGKKMKKKWFFKYPHQLLIFGENAFSSTASDSIHQLIELGYPKDKIFYYRGGILAWKMSGLVLI